MSAATVIVTPLSILLPEDVLATPWFALLATFVAINTVMYVALAAAKTLPKLHVGGWRRRRYQRAETRSIYPDGPV